MKQSLLFLIAIIIGAFPSAASASHSFGCYSSDARLRIGQMYYKGEVDWIPSLGSFEGLSVAYDGHRAFAQWVFQLKHDEKILRLLAFNSHGRVVSITGKIVPSVSDEWEKFYVIETGWVYVNDKWIDLKGLQVGCSSG